MLIGSFTINKTGLSLKEKIIQTILIWHYYILNIILLAFQKVLFRNKNLSQSKRILIFRTGSIGDSICALPAINSIRKNFPQAEIDILTNAGAENLISLGAVIDRSIPNEIIDYYGIDKKNLINKLKKKQYDLFIELPQDQATVTRQIRDMFFVRLIGIRNAFGWEKAATRFLAKWQAKLITFVNERERLLNIIIRNGLKSFGLAFPLDIDDAVRIRVNLLVAENNLIEKEKNIGLVVGAKREQNRWPIEYFQEVADHLMNKEFNVLLFGGQEDRMLTQQIKGERVFNYCGELTPLETAGLMKHCKLVISNDSGPMHLAYAVCTKVVAIFSSRDYTNKWYPPDNNISLRNNNELCTECFNICKRDHECLKKITPATILELLKSSLTIN